MDFISKEQVLEKFHFVLQRASTIRIKKYPVKTLIIFSNLHVYHQVRLDLSLGILS